MSAWGQSWGASWGASWGPVVAPEVYSGGNARIGGSPAIDALERIGLAGAAQDGAAIGVGTHDQAARIGGSPDSAPQGRVGLGIAKAQPGRIG